jgi:hypothetical protein
MVEPYLYLKFHTSLFYIDSCEESGSLWIPTIYSFTYNSSMYNIKYIRLSIIDHDLTHIAHVTTAA